MNAETLTLIRKECEKIEKGSGHGYVLIKIQDSIPHIMQAMESTILDKPEKKC